MSNLPSMRGQVLIQALERAGFAVIRIRGSHHCLRHPDGRTTVVLVHAGETIRRGLLSKILSGCQMSREKFLALLR